MAKLPTNLIYLGIFCFVLICFFRKDPQLELATPRREWRGSFEEQQLQLKQQEGNVISLRDCLKSMSIAFLLGGNASEIDLTSKTCLPPSRYKPQIPYSKTNKNSRGEAKSTYETGMRVDQQGRSYRIGRGGRKVFKRKRLGERVRKIVAASQKWRCFDCNELLSASFEVDHVVPVCKGGGNDISNLNAVCRNCHGARTSRQGIEFKF